MSCLFNSLCKFVSDSSQRIRHNICDYLATNPKINDVLASDFIMWETGLDLTKYVNQMRSLSTWGGAIEISAFTHLYKMDVHVMNIRDTGKLTIVRYIEFKCPESTHSMCKISWNGYHYEPLFN